MCACALAQRLTERARVAQGEAVDAEAQAAAAGAAAEGAAAAGCAAELEAERASAEASRRAAEAKRRAHAYTCAMACVCMVPRRAGEGAPALLAQTGSPFILFSLLLFKRQVPLFCFPFYFFLFF